MLQVVRPRYTNLSSNQRRRAVRSREAGSLRTVSRGGVMPIRATAGSMIPASGATAALRGVNVHPGVLTTAQHVARATVSQPMRRQLDTSATLDTRLRSALMDGPEALEALVGAEAVDRRDGVLALLRIHDLHLAPLEDLAGSVQWQHHPAIADLKWRLERTFVESVRAYDAERTWTLPTDPVRALRMIAQVDRVPAVYEWLADQALARPIRGVRRRTRCCGHVVRRSPL